MRYISSTEYQSHFLRLNVLLEKYKKHPSFVSLSKVISLKIKYDLFKKSFQQILHSLEMEAKEHHEHYMLFDSEQFELSSDDYYEKRRELEYQIKQLPKKGALLSSALSKAKKELKTECPELFNVLQKEILLLSAEKEEEYRVVSTQLKNISDSLRFIIRTFCIDDMAFVACDAIKDGYSVRFKIEKEITKRRFYFEKVNENNVAVRREFIDFSNEELLKTPLTKLIECLEIIQEETKNFSEEELQRLIEKTNMNSDRRIYRRLVGVCDKMKQILVIYEDIKRIDSNYKLIVLK